jgi:hypothetical protein
MPADILLAYQRRWIEFRAVVLMSHLRQTIRTYIAVLIGVGYLGSMPGMTATLASWVMDHGHEHEMVVVDHGGHSDLVFHHDDHDEDDHDEPAPDHDDEHGCHVIELGSQSIATLGQSLSVPPPSVAILAITPVTAPGLIGYAPRRQPSHARPPPEHCPGTLACLRTVVLRV